MVVRSGVSVWTSFDIIVIIINVILLKRLCLFYLEATVVNIDGYLTSVSKLERCLDWMINTINSNTLFCMRCYRNSEIKKKIVMLLLYLSRYVMEIVQLKISVSLVFILYAMFWKQKVNISHN